MSTDPGTATARIGFGVREWDLRTVRTVRMAFGATLAMTVAQLFEWPLSFAAPALVVALLELPINRPSNKEFLLFLGSAVLSVAAVFLLVLLLQPYPRAFVPAYALAIFWLTYSLHKGAPLVPMLLTLLAIVILPIPASVDDGLTLYLGGCFLLAEIVGLVVVQMAFGLFPDPPGTEQPAEAVFQAGYLPSAVPPALLTTVVVAPAMVAFLVFNWAPLLVVMLYIGLIAFEGSQAHSLYDTKKYLIANCIAGITALLVYFTLVAVPEPYFLVPVIFFATLVFSSLRFSDRPIGKYFGSATIGLLILLSGSMGATADVDKNIIIRVFYIFLAGMYAIGVMSIAEPILNPGAKDAEH